MTLDSEELLDVKMAEILPPKPTGELAHYGVKGMRWGVRKDRRPSFAGFFADRRKRREEAKAEDQAFGGSSDQILGRYRDLGTGKKTDIKSEFAFLDVRQEKKRKTDALTNSELQATIERMELEKKYKELSDIDLTRGQRFRRHLSKAAGKGAEKLLEKGTEKLIESLLDKATAKKAGRAVDGVGEAVKKTKDAAEPLSGKILVPTRKTRRMRKSPYAQGYKALRALGK